MSAWWLWAGAALAVWVFIAWWAWVLFVARPRRRFVPRIAGPYEYEARRERE